MKKIILPLLLLSFYMSYAGGQFQDPAFTYTVPDSIKAIAFIAETGIQAVLSKKESFAGIRAGDVKLAFESDKKQKEIVFEFPVSATVKATGIGIDAEPGELSWDYNWSLNEQYKLMLATATDSAENFMLYSGYIWLPKETKWKLIGTCKIAGQWGTIKEASVYTSPNLQTNTGNAWLQRNTGSWKQVKGNEAPITVNLFNHIDSIRQGETENAYIRDAIAKGNTDAKDTIDGVYYKIMKEGNGRQVSVNDTVTVHYRLTMFRDGSLIEETKDKPATFPLKRLIKAWQSALPLCKAGGKIKLVIPSALAYSIRTRAAKIPPNSILQFEIEVVDAKPPQ